MHYASKMGCDEGPLVVERRLIATFNLELDPEATVLGASEIRFDQGQGRPFLDFYLIPEDGGLFRRIVSLVLTFDSGEEAKWK